MQPPTDSWVIRWIDKDGKDGNRRQRLCVSVMNTEECVSILGWMSCQNSMLPETKFNNGGSAVELKWKFLHSKWCIFKFIQFDWRLLVFRWLKRWEKDLNWGKCILFINVGSRTRSQIGEVWNNKLIKSRWGR